MKKTILTISILCFAAIGANSQKGKLIPPQTKITDPSLKVFITKLKTAVKNHDEDFIIAHLSETVQCSFGGEYGVKDFENIYLGEHIKEFWGTMKEIVNQGGDYSGENSYSFPYVYTNWPDEYDAFEYHAITGSNVNVRDKPNLKTSKVVGKLTYDIVKVDWDKSEPIDGDIDPEEKDWVGDRKWYYVKQAEGTIEGYVYWDYVYSPIGFRLGLTKEEGNWVISYFIAGD